MINITDYSKCTIVNIHRGKASDNRSHIIYANLIDDKGQLVISATLDYIIDTIKLKLV
jgi:hypothetical protein